MKVIKEYVDLISEEIDDAKNYAEKYLYCKSMNDIKSAKYYMDMAADELRHADHLHEMAIAQIENLRKVYTPPAEMEDVWSRSHTNFVEKTAWVKQMLAM